MYDKFDKNTKKKKIKITVNGTEMKTRIISSLETQFKLELIQFSICKLDNFSIVKTKIIQKYYKKKKKKNRRVFCLSRFEH